MKRRQRYRLNPYWSACLTLLCTQANGADELLTADLWELKLTPQFTYVGYSGSKLRSDMVNAGLYFDAQYSDRGGIAGGATYSQLNYKGSTSSLNQAAEFLSGRLNFKPDFLPGRLSLSLDGHQINNDDSSNESDDVQVLAPQLSFLNNSQWFYADLGYAISFYGKSSDGNGSLTVQQWTPTLGFGFNKNHDWLQLRLYDVNISNPLRALHDHTDAVEIKLTHYFSPIWAWIPNSMTIGGLAGNRMYAVDSDTKLVYNLADEQKGGGFLAAQWKLSEHYQVTLSAGSDIYQTQDTVSGNQYTYTGTFGYLGFTTQW